MPNFSYRARGLNSGDAIQLGDLIIDLVRGVSAWLDLDVEDLTQLGVEPEPHRRAAISAPVRAQRAKRLTGLLFTQVRLADAELGQFDAMGMQHSVDVMVRRDQ